MSWCKKTSPSSTNPSIELHHVPMSTLFYPLCPLILWISQTNRGRSIQYLVGSGPHGMLTQSTQMEPIFFQVTKILFLFGFWFFLFLSWMLNLWFMCFNWRLLKIMIINENHALRCREYSCHLWTQVTFELILSSLFMKIKTKVLPFQWSL